MTVYQEILQDPIAPLPLRRAPPRAGVFLAGPSCRVRHTAARRTAGVPALAPAAVGPTAQPGLSLKGPALPWCLAFAGALLGLLAGYALGIHGSAAGALAPVAASAQGWGELLGYIASALVFAAFYMRSIVWIRATAIASNLFFIAYGALFGLLPILVLHALLLPLNLWRLRELLAGRSSR